MVSGSMTRNIQTYASPWSFCCSGLASNFRTSRGRDQVREWLDAAVYEQLLSASQIWSSGVPSFIGYQKST